MTYNSFWALQAESCQDVLSDLHRELAGHFASPKAFSLDGPAAPPPPPYEIHNGVAVIRVSGVIDRVARISFFTGLPYTEGQNRIRRAVETALADAQVRGILFSINSPGGTAAGAKELADFIAASAAQKPMAAYADGLCASAAYWLASATGAVFAPVTAQVGSIGVIAVLTDWTKAAEKAGLVRTVLASGQWKAAGSPDKTLTDDERALFQGQLETLHSIFKSDVSSRMGISAPESQWAEGQTVLGAKALELGLVSRIARDQAEAEAMFAESIGKEDFMDLKDLKANHPELMEELAGEVRKQCEKDSQKAIADARSETFALIRAVAGDEIAAKIEAVVKAGVTASQLQALQPMLAAASGGKPTEEEARELMLGAIRQATGDPLPNGGKVPHSRKSQLVADAERRASQRMVV